jgi:hypothetical protein
LKRDVRFLGIDDGPFERGDDRTQIVGVVTRGASYIEGVLTSEVAVDGTDATDTLIRLVRSTKFRPLIRCVFLNGIAVGGFNVVDLDALYEATRIPVVTLSRTRPDPPAIRRALKATFDSWRNRWNLIQSFRPTRVRNGRFWVYATPRGATLSEATRWIQATTVRGAIPEPVRLAHVIASGVSRGESGGRV